MTTEEKRQRQKINQIAHYNRKRILNDCKRYGEFISNKDIIYSVYDDIKNFMNHYNAFGPQSPIDAYIICHYFCIVYRNTYKFDQLSVKRQVGEMVIKLNKFIEKYKKP